MQSIDGFLHVRPFVEDSPFRGLAMFFNPTNHKIKEIIEIPLYYTGLTTQAKVTLEGKKGATEQFELDRDYSIEVAISKIKVLFSNFHTICNNFLLYRFEAQILHLDAHRISHCHFKGKVF